MWICSIFNCRLHFSFTFLSLCFYFFLIHSLKLCMLANHTDFVHIQTASNCISHLFSIHRSSLFLIAVPQSLSHPSALYNFYSSFCALSLHQSTFYSLWLVAIKGSPLPHPGTPRAPEGHRTGPANQNAANTATELFTGSGQQAFCIQLL